MSPEMTSLWVVAVRGILGMMATALIVIAISVELVAEEKLIGNYIIVIIFITKSLIDYREYPFHLQFLINLKVLNLTLI